MTSPLQQKIKVTGPVVITANRTTDGIVIYRTANGGWSAALQDAAVVTTAEAALALLKEASADGVHAIGPYIAPVAIGADERIAPGNLREQIRTRGPSIALPVPG